MQPKRSFSYVYASSSGSVPLNILFIVLKFQFITTVKVFGFLPAHELNLYMREVLHKDIEKSFISASFERWIEVKFYFCM